MSAAVKPVFAADAVPAIARLFRLQWEPAQQAHVLLYPEGMVKLNHSAGEILTRCDGRRTVAEIVAELEQSFATRGLAPEVEAFLAMAEEQGWIETTPTFAALSEGRLCTADPLRGHEAALREFPASPPHGGAALLGSGPAEGRTPPNHSGAI